MNKRIGVLLCEGQGQYQSTLLTGIQNCAHRLGYDLLVFSNFVKACHNINTEISENNIFQLVNFDLLDGVIVVPDTMRQSRLETGIYDLLKKAQCPIVLMDTEQDHGYINVMVDDSLPFEVMIDHLIDVHHCKKIMFYSGPLEVATTRMRLQGYKRSLEKHGIPVRKELIRLDGNFWYESGDAIAQEILTGDCVRPDAIAFCGDYMALGAMETFQRSGWRIPDDIILTGYDAIDDALRCKPPLTSYDPPIATAGENAVRLLDSAINHSESPAKLRAPGRLNIGGSCGCSEDLNYTKRLFRKQESQGNIQSFLGSNFMEELAEAEDFEILQKRIAKYLFMIDDYNDFYLCLTGDWITPGALNSSEQQLLQEGYPEQMNLYIQAQDRNTWLGNLTFDTSQMLPALFSHHDHPKTYYFTPIHINRRNFGYSVLCYNKSRVYDFNYMNWIRHISLTLDYHRVLSSITDNATTDPLTGLNNRSGLSHRMTMIRRNFAVPNARAFCMVVDLDGLKEINDKQGHAFGDQAIVAISKVLTEAKGPFEICARTGGDEFLLMGCDIYPDDYESQKMTLMEQILERENASGRFSFRLAASFGTCMRPIESVKDFDAVLKDADAAMYEMKRLHHEKFGSYR